MPIYSKFKSLEHWINSEQQDPQHKLNVCLSILEELGKIHIVMKIANNNINTANVVVSHNKGQA